MSESAPAPTVKGMRYPMIVPVMQYPFNRNRCIDKARTRDTRYEEDDFWMAMNDARFYLYNPLYGIAKFKDSRGHWRVVDGGLMTTPIYDFCGGMMVTSAFVRSYLTGTGADMWGDSYWRSVFPAYGDREFAKQYNASAMTSKWKEFADLIPDLHAYCGPDPISADKAESVMQDSLGAALITTSWNTGRRGMFAADRVTANPNTRRVVHAASEMTHAYGQLPGVTEWAGMHGRTQHQPRAFADYAGAIVYRASARFVPGDNYLNPNSGHTVAMCGAIVDQSNGTPSIIYRATQKENPWELPEQEAGKFKNPVLFDMLPQALFHNA